MADVLVENAPSGARRLAVVAVALLVVVVAGGAALRSTLPPPPLDVRVAGVSGTALLRDRFAQVRVSLESQQVSELDEALLTVAGTTVRGRHAPRFDQQGELTVQFEVAPECDQVGDGLLPGRLQLTGRAGAGEERSVELEVPTDGPLGRLLASSCQQ